MTRNNFYHRALGLLIAIVVCFASNVKSAPPDDSTHFGTNVKAAAAWMRKAKYGILVHYLDVAQNEKQPWNMGKKTSWDSCVNEFNVNLFARQMNRLGVGYVIFTVFQGTKHFCIPNTTFEQLTGYKRGEATSHRDLVADLYNALHRYNIRLMLYVTGNGTYKDPKSSAALGNPILKVSQNGNKYWVDEKWVNNWAKVMQDISMRYGDRVSGWWVDGAYRFQGYNDTLLGILAKALKAGNPNSAVAFNPAPQKKVMYYSKWDDYTAGEMDQLGDLPPAGGELNGDQWHLATYVGKRWLGPEIRFTKDSLVNYINHVNELGGVVTLDVCLLRNGSIYPPQFEFLRKVSKDIKPR